MSTGTSTRALNERSVRRAGSWCLAAGLLGVVQGGTLLAWSPQVPETRYSYPTGEAGFVVAQASFFLQHLLLIAGMTALHRLPAVRASRAARVAVRAAAVGLVLLAVTELVAVSAYDSASDSTHATVVNTLYGPPLLLIGSGLVIAGSALLRRGHAGSDAWAVVWDGARWLPAVVVALGGYIVVLLAPGIMGSFIAGRLAIAGWMLLFAVFGYGLTRLSDDITGGRW